MASTQSGLETDLHQVKKLDSNRKMALVLLIGGLFVASILVGRMLSSKTPVSQETPVETDVTTQAQLPSTSLELTPATLSLKVGETQKVSVSLSSLTVTAIDVALLFDPANISVSVIQNGVVFDTVIQSKTNAGQILYSAAVNPTNKDSLRTGEVVSFMVTAKKASTSTISFDPLKTKTALNGENTLGKTNETTITVTK